MSITTIYNHDIFISYSRADNLTVGDSYKGWVDNLHERLDLRLPQFLGESPSIFRDRKLSGHDVFDDELVNTSLKSAIMLCVLSPEYLRSEWCLRELNAFYNHAVQNGSLLINNKCRILKVLKTPISYGDQPSVLKDFLGYEFYGIDQESKVREFNPETSTRDIRYWEKFDDLTFDIKSLIELIADPRYSLQTQNPIPTASLTQYSVVNRSGSSRPLRVFLCHSSNDKPAVRTLYRQLLTDAIAPWLDEEDLLPGQKWELEIPKAVRQSDIVIVCLSQGAISKSGFIQKEIKFSLDVADEQPEGTIFLIPLKLEECDVPDRLSCYQWVNIFEEKGYERLMRSLRARASALSVSIESVT